MQFIFETFSKELLVDSLITNFSKAFDSTNHFVLQRKLTHFRFNVNLLGWFYDYCSVELRYKKYKEIVTLLGVPRGLHLAPFLFDIFINVVRLLFDLVQH